jgi:hypothetical protein
MCPSLLVGNQHPLIQASQINRLTDSLERFEATLATLALVKKVPDSLFDQFLAALIPAAGKLLLDLVVQIGR